MSADSIFAKLYKIDVSPKLEKKAGLSYLSWAWAWQEVLKVDPTATWRVNTYGMPGAEMPCMFIGNSAMVHVTVTINGLSRDCMLPVMDNRNKAIANPDARQISDSIMRCMVKAVAMHGLGLFVYAGEDLPEEDKPEQKPETPEEKAARRFNLTVERVRELDEIMDHMIEQHNAGHTLNAVRVCHENVTTNDEKLYVWESLKDHPSLRGAIKANKPETTPQPVAA